MSNFNELIKQKIEQFDAPYNEAHWAEMNGKLNQIRSAKIRNNLFIAAGAIAVIAISSILYFNNTTENSDQIVNNKTSNTFTNNTPPENTIPTTEKPVTEIEKEGTPLIITKENKLKNTGEIQTETTKLNTLEEKGIDSKKIETEEIYKTETLVNETPSAEFIVYNNRTCLGGEVSFESMENDLPISYIWNFGDGTISHKTNPTHIYKESLVYTVTLTLLNRETGIEYTTIQQDVVTILPLPKVAFTYSEESKKHDDNALKYPHTTFNLKEVEKDNTYQWVFGNGEISKNANTKTIYKTGGTYVVKLISMNSYGCENSTKKKVAIKNGTNLYAPNAFTPNSDGENDNFIPKALLAWDIQFEMIITDLSNKVIYKTSDKNEPWKGNFNNNGSVLPKGIYLWKVTTYDAEGKIYQHAGKVNLLN